MNNIRVRGVMIFNVAFVRRKSYFTERFNKNFVSSPVINKFRLNNVVQDPNYSCVRYCETLSGSQKNEIAKERLKKYIADPDNEKQYKILQLEVEVMRQNGENVPDLLLERHWLELTMLDTRAKRRKYLDFLFGLEKKKEHEMEKKQRRREELRAHKENPPAPLPDHMNYKLGGNSPFLRFRETLMNKLYNWRLLRAMMYGRHIVFDCGYEDNMTRNETKNCAKQLQLAFAANRIHDEPLYMHYCNYNFEGFLHEELISFVPTMLEPEFPLTITSKSYMDCFDRNNLVYLTPDCHTDVDLNDEDAIYIIGAIVDKVSGQPLSLARAKKDGIKMARLPIDNHLHFGSGSNKSLTLNQMTEILCDALHTHDWEYALRHVPRRKLYDYRQNLIRNKINKFLRNTEPKSTNLLKDFSMSSRNKFRIK